MGDEGDKRVERCACRHRLGAGAMSRVSAFSRPAVVTATRALGGLDCDRAAAEFEYFRGHRR